MERKRGKNLSIIKKAIEDGTFYEKTLTQWGHELGITKEAVRLFVKRLDAEPRKRLSTVVWHSKDKVGDLFVYFLQRRLLKRIGNHWLYSGRPTIELLGDVRKWVYFQAHIQDKRKRTWLRAVTNCGEDTCINPDHIEIIKVTPKRNLPSDRVERGKRYALC